PARRVYIPAGSYPEMAEWALEPNAAKRYAQARNKLDAELSPLVAAPLWRNFFAQYPESNGLQKRVLIVSEELARRSILDAAAEWDIYASATNLVDTLARRPEAEHEALRRAEKSGKVLVGKAAEKETKSIHEAVRARERGLSKLLEYDVARRAFFQDSFRVG